MPTEFFTVIRPEEIVNIIPQTWHEYGISFWGRKGDWRYEVQFLAGLDAERFSDVNWIKDGSLSPYEFKLANTYAGAFRVDNYSVKGLRMGLSGYVGGSAKNNLKAEKDTGTEIVSKFNYNGTVAIGSFDFTYRDHNLIAMGNVLYGHLWDSQAISAYNKKMSNASPSAQRNVASDAFCAFVEAGYDMFSFFPKLHEHKLYLFGHYGYYDSMFRTESGILDDNRFERHFVAAGINYYPLPQIAIKAQFSSRLFKQPYNNENTISIGITYAGFFELF